MRDFLSVSPSLQIPVHCRPFKAGKWRCGLREGGCCLLAAGSAGSFLTQSPGRCRGLTPRAGICKALQSCCRGPQSVVALSRSCLSALGGDLRHCSPEECHLITNFLLQPALSSPLGGPTGPRTSHWLLFPEAHVGSWEAPTYPLLSGRAYWSYLSPALCPPGPLDFPGGSQSSALPLALGGICRVLCEVLFALLHQVLPPHLHTSVLEWEVGFTVQLAPKMPFSIHGVREGVLRLWVEVLTQPL